jgi:hypothetical protein
MERKAKCLKLGWEVADLREKNFSATPDTNRVSELSRLKAAESVQ